MSARDTLIEELRRHALVRGEVTLTSGATARYYVDAKRAVLRPAGFAALGELVAAYAHEWEATAVGGLTMGADAPACAALAGGADVKAFFVRKEAKAHGLQRRVEGPLLRCGRLLQRPHPARPPGRDHGDRGHQLDVHRAHRARSGPVAAREGVRRGRALARRL